MLPVRPLLLALVAALLAVPAPAAVAGTEEGEAAYDVSFASPQPGGLYVHDEPVLEGIGPLVLVKGSVRVTVHAVAQGPDAPELVRIDIVQQWHSPAGWSDVATPRTCEVSGHEAMCTWHDDFGQSTTNGANVRHMLARVHDAAGGVHEARVDYVQVSTGTVDELVGNLT